MADRERLEKLIGMLGSEHDGERANAARFIHRMAQESKLTIVELFTTKLGIVSGAKQSSDNWSGATHDQTWWGEQMRRQANSNRDRHDENARKARERNAKQERDREREQREREWEKQREWAQRHREQTKRREQTWGQDNDAILSKLQACVGHECLTEWEQEFASNVSMRYLDDVDLSEAQYTVAERIVRKVDKWKRYQNAEPLI